MKKFYRVLEASESASAETLELLFEQKATRLQREIDSGNPSSKEQLWALRQAFDTLSNPDKREAYDLSFSSQSTASISRSSEPPPRDGISWKTTTILLGLLGAGIVGFGLHIAGTSKKDENKIQLLKVVRSTDNDATRAASERVLVEGTLHNQEKAIDSHGQISNRIVNVEETAEMRRSRELEYKASAAAEQLRQQQARIDIGNQQLQWERKQQEQALALQQAKARMAADRMSTIQIMLSGGRIDEARTYAISTEERAAVESAEQARRELQRSLRSQR